VPQVLDLSNLGLRGLLQEDCPLPDLGKEHLLTQTEFAHFVAGVEPVKLRADRAAAGGPPPI
jgi:hypothetical protein